MWFYQDVNQWTMRKARINKLWRGKLNQGLQNIIIHRIFNDQGITNRGHVSLEMSERKSLNTADHLHPLTTTTGYTVSRNKWSKSCFFCIFLGLRCKAGPYKQKVWLGEEFVNPWFRVTRCIDDNGCIASARNVTVSRKRRNGSAGIVQIIVEKHISCRRKWWRPIWKKMNTSLFLFRLILFNYNLYVIIMLLLKKFYYVIIQLLLLLLL